MRIKMIYRIIIKTLCFIVLLSQIYFVSVNYFKYDTRTRVDIYRREEIRSPALAFCLYTRALSKETFNWTAKELLDRSPPKETLITMFKRKSQFKYGFLNYSDINDLVITKGIR